ALELRTRVRKVALVTKGPLSSGSTPWAQGGIAAALAPEDSPAAHLADTLAAGAGLCDPRAVEVLVTEGPERVRELVDRGARFDLADDGAVALTREGGHHADRIVHAGGDATGAEVSRALVAQIEAVRADPGIEVIEHGLVIDVLTAAPGPDGAPGPACGVTLHVIGEGTRDGPGVPLLDQPRRRDRGRDRGGAAGGGARGGHGVRPVPPDRAVARRGRARSAHARLGGRAWRGCGPARHRGRAFHARGAPARRARPARRRRPGDRRACPRDRFGPRVARRAPPRRRLPARALPDDPRAAPRARDRPDHG